MRKSVLERHVFSKPGRVSRETPGGQPDRRENLQPAGLNRGGWENWSRSEAEMGESKAAIINRIQEPLWILDLLSQTSPSGLPLAPRLGRYAEIGLPPAFCTNETASRNQRPPSAPFCPYPATVDAGYTS